MLIDLPSANSVVDQKLGAYIGLLCALGIALGGCEQMLEERTRAGPRVRPGRGGARRVAARWRGALLSAPIRGGTFELRAEAVARDDTKERRMESSRL